MRNDDRAARDAAGIGPYARERAQLVPLSTLESWKVSDGEPDVRGWEIRTVSGRQIGLVHDLLIDPKAGEVVLIDVDLPGSDRHTYVPIRVAEIDRERRLVLMDSADLPTTDADTPRPSLRRAATADREIALERPLSDQPLAADDDATVTNLDANAAIVERRRAERRRIDRLSTDL